MKINMKYVVAFLVLFIIEVVIAVFVHDAIIRPFVGDALVIVLMYTFIRGIVKRDIRFLALVLFSFACVVELAQYFRIVDVLHLGGNKILSIIIGTSYDIRDIFSYFAGFLILVVWGMIEKRGKRKSVI